MVTSSLLIHPAIKQKAVLPFGKPILDLNQERDLNATRENFFATSTFEPPKTFSAKAQHFAEWICSRESLFRFGLDITGWILPTLVGAATRNWYSFAEALFQTGLEVTGMGFATQMTGLANKISGMMHLDSEENKQLKNLMLFEMRDLQDDAAMQSATSRIKNDEILDLDFKKGIGGLSGNQHAGYAARAQEIENYFSNFTVDAEQRERLKKFKKSVILIDSSIQSFIWGGYFLANRLFRKYVLGQERFTGTKAYANDQESKKVGDSTPLTWFQRIGIAFSMISAPLMNSQILKLLDNKKLAENPWVKTIKNQWDVTHGLYPKLGLLWSYCFIPVTLGGLFSAQGKSEFIEQILTQLIMGNSWFFGHRATNGVLAKLADNALSKKHGVEKGLLVEKSYLHHPFPEPAKIQHVLKEVQGNPELEKDARQAHAKVLYGGFALHSGLVLAVRLLINQFTKWRVKKELNT